MNVDTEASADALSFPRGLEGALEGVRVLDFTQNLPGPYATMLLSSLGAEVMKVEPPRGDTGRLVGRMFELLNAGKKSAVVDLSSAAERGALFAALPEWDVLVEGFRPGVMARHGLGPREALAAHPDLVYCSVSAYGQRGPYRDRPGHDLNLQAITGVCEMLANAEHTPLGCALPIADLSSGSSAAQAIIAALYTRERGGGGRHLDIALADTVLSWAHIWSEGLTPSDARPADALDQSKRLLAESIERGGPLEALGELTLKALNAPLVKKAMDGLGERALSSERYARLRRVRLHALPHYAIFECRDGRHLSVGIVDEDKFWRALCEGLDLPALAFLPLGVRALLGPQLRARIRATFRERDLDDWLDRLDPEAIPIAPVRSVAEARSDPQMRLRGVLPDGSVRAPFPFLGAEVGSAPRLGEHTDELFSSENPASTGS